MADINLQYPQKLGRFSNGSCMTLYYSEPIAKGVYKGIAEGTSGDIGYILLDLTITEFSGWCPAGAIFSSGIISGEVESNDNNTTITVKVNKDSFVTATALTDFITKHNSITYNFEVLIYYNETDAPVNAVLSNLMINTKKRINNYYSYSPFGFNYNKDFYYEIETKNIVLRDLSQIDDIIRASSFVIKSEDTSYIRAGALDDLPRVIGISGDTANIIDQPYFGGLQNNEWYRATMIDNEFIWDRGRYKGKFKFKVTG